MLLVRLVLIFNPIGLRVEVFNNEESYAQMAKEANGRPLIVNTRYTTGAKYIFYTGGEVFCQASSNHRTSQWDFRDDDDRFIGREVIVEVEPNNYSEQERRERVTSVKLANGKMFNYVVLHNFHPVRRVEIEPKGFQMAEKMRSGDRIATTLSIYNPYPYDITVDGKEHTLEMCWRWRTRPCTYFPLSDESFTIGAGERVEIDVVFTLPDSEQLPEREYTVGFAVRHRDIPSWYNSKRYHTRIDND